LAAVMVVPLDTPLHIIFRQSDMPNLLIRDLQALEDKGWIGCKRTQATRALITTLRKRCAPTTMETASDTPTFQELNAVADSIKESDEESRVDLPLPRIDESLELSGARMSTLTQALAYRGFREMGTAEERPATRRRLSEVTAHLANTRNDTYTEAEVWRGVWQKDIRRPVRDFLWKAMHDALRCGEYWRRIEGYEDRGVCGLCSGLESIEHILVRCQSESKRMVWAKCAALWERKQADNWEDPALSDILTAGVHKKGRKEKKRARPGAARLKRILITETARLIWVLRCERQIQHADDPGWAHGMTEVERRWEAIITDRLRMDMALTRLRGRRAAAHTLTLQTWGGLLANEDALPEDW
ncbi:hypothetical protein FOMPIDRAFT_1088374, partial [Fomitopsis schrenkii]